MNISPKPRSTTPPSSSDDPSVSTKTLAVDSQTGIEFRHPTVRDGAAIWQLVDDCDVLETNTCYAYLLIARDFSASSLVAYRDGQLLGFVAGYNPPMRPEHLFIWQVGVSRDARRMGLAKRMLLELWSSPECQSCFAMEATVAVSNEASRRLFQSVADVRQASFQRLPGFESDDFGPSPQDQHEPEETVLIRLPRS